MFRANDIDVSVLPRLTAADLKDLGISSVGDRRRLLDAIAVLRKASSPSRELATATLAHIAHGCSSSGSTEPERRQLTILFLDLVGSTSLAHRLDPEDLREVMHAFHRRAAAMIEQFGGFVARYMGDGLLTYFGWPVAHEDDAERAVRAGLAVVEAVARLETSALEPLQVRVGIATGLTVVGVPLGDGIARELAAVGETLNLAARLQELALPGTVLIAAGTRRLIGEWFKLRELDPCRVAGFDAPVRSFLVTGESEAEGRFEALRATTLSPLVGREEEIDHLLDRWATARAGHGQVVLLCGEPGIGKSRTVLALIERLKGTPCTIMRYHGSPYHTTSALFPILAQLERAAGLSRSDSPATKLDKLEELFGRAVADPRVPVSLIAEFLEIPAEGHYPRREQTPQQRKSEIFKALLAQLDGLAARQPVLVLLEDAHWVDATTLELFELVVERVRDRAALVVVTFRPEYQPAWTRHGHVTQLGLSRLGAEDAARVAVSNSGGRALPHGVLERIVSKADGVPLFIEELTKAVVESGLLCRVGQHYELTLPLPEFAVPSSLQDSLMARLDRFAPIREVAQVGAVIGREFSYGLLAAVISISESHLQQALDQLIAAELVFRCGASGEGRYAFKHALVRDAAYGSLLKHRRQQIHGRVAELLEARYPQTAAAQPELVAQHYAGAGLIFEAARCYLAAGRRAAARGAVVEAAAQLREGLDLLGSLPDTPERWRMAAGLRLALAVVTRANKGAAAMETVEAYREAGRACEHADDVRGVGRALLGEFMWLYNRAALDRAQEAAARLRQLGATAPDAALRLAGHFTIGVLAFSRGDFAHARVELEQIAAADQQHTYEMLGTDAIAAPVYLAFALLILGLPRRAIASCHRALEAARQTGEPNATAVALGNACLFHYLRADFIAVRTTASRLQALTEGLEMSTWWAVAAVFRGWTIAWEGRPDAGLVMLRDGARKYRALNVGIEVPLHLAMAVDILALARRRDEAKRLLKEAIERADRTGERWFDAELHRLAGRLALQAALPDRSGARACFERALATASSQGAKLWELRAAASLARLGDQGARATISPVSMGSSPRGAACDR